MLAQICQFALIFFGGLGGGAREGKWNPFYPKKRNALMQKKM